MGLSKNIPIIASWTAPFAPGTNVFSVMMSGIWGTLNIIGSIILCVEDIWREVRGTFWHGNKAGRTDEGYGQAVLCIETS